MGRIKDLVYRMLFFIIDIKYRRKVARFIEQHKKANTIFFVDIDNTIADTWPTFLKKWPSEAERLSNIVPFAGMKNYLQTIHQQEETLIIYLTARNFRHTSLTQNWLQTHGFPQQRTMLVLVQSAHHKLRYLKIPEKHTAVTFIDDLCYGHEKGIVKKYETVIAAVKKLPVTYIGAETIDNLNSQYANIN